MKQMGYLGVCLLLISALLLGCTSEPKAEATPPAPQEAGFPVTLTDAQHVSVTIPSRPQRIVSGAPSVTEILFAIGVGDRVVGVTEQCNYPPEVKKLPRIGSFWTPSAEKVLGLQPDLFIGQRGNPENFSITLRKVGLSAFVTDPKVLEDIPADIRQIGRIVGAEEGADKVISEMQARLSAITEQLADVPASKRPTAFIFSQVGPVWTAGAGTFQDDALRIAGGRNAAGRIKGFKEFSSEVLLAADPDYLLVTTMDREPELMKQQILTNPALKRLTAAKQNRIIILDGDEVTRPGPRIVTAIETMARVFYPEKF